MVGLRNFAAGQIVELLGEPLDEAAAVAEHDGRSVGLDQLEQPGIHERPDRPGGWLVGIINRSREIRTGHILQGHYHLDIELLLPRCVDDRHRTGVPTVVEGAAAPEEPSDFRQRPLRGRQPDPLRTVRQLLETLQAEGEMGASFGARNGVDLIHDHPPDGGENLSHLRRQHEVQGLRGGYEHVGRRAHHPATLVGGCVSRAHSRSDVGQVEAEPSGSIADSG